MTDLPKEVQPEIKPTGDTNVAAQQLSQQVSDIKPAVPNAKNGPVTTMSPESFLAKSDKDDEVKKPSDPTDRNGSASDYNKSQDSKDTGPKKPSKPNPEYDPPSTPRPPKEPPPTLGGEPNPAPPRRR